MQSSIQRLKRISRLRSQLLMNNAFNDQFPFRRVTCFEDFEITIAQFSANIIEENKFSKQIFFLIQNILFYDEITIYVCFSFANQ